MLSGLPFPRRVAAAIAIVLATGCGVDPALQVHVTLAPAVKASCVEISAYPSADVSGTPAESKRVVRSAGKDGFYLAIYRGSLPGQVWVAARPLWGADCQDPLSPNGAAAVASGTFPSSGVTPMELAVAAPSVAEDGDGDGFVGAPAGPDCDDGDGAVHPGAAERCLEPGDFDCDGNIGCADTGCPPSACLATPTALAFVTPPRTLVAGACSGDPVTVETRGGAGVAMAVLAPTAVSFSSPDATLQLFSDSQCLVAISSVTIPAGGTLASAYVSGTVAGSGNVSASAPGLGSATQAQTIQPAATSQVVFTSPAQTVALGGCSEPVVAQLRDAFGNPTPVGAARTLALSSDGGGTFRFYPDAACSQANITQAPVAAGASTATFHVRSTATSPGTVTITVADGPRAANQAVDLVQRTPTQLAFTTGPFTVPLGACSPAVVVQTQDATGLPAPVSSSTTVGLGAAPGGTLTFYSDAACSAGPISQVAIGAGLHSAGFHFRGDQQGQATITASTAAFGSPQQVETISAPLPTQLAFTTAAQPSVPAGQCSAPVDIDTQTAGGIPAPVSAATAIDLAQSPPGQLALHQGPGCTGSPVSSVTMDAGTSRVTISFLGTLAASTTITASTDGGTLAPAQQVEGVVAGPAARVQFVSGDGQSVNAGTCSGAVVLELQDAHGNPVTAATTETVGLEVSPAGAVTFSSASDCTGSITATQVSSGAQRATFYFQGTAPQSITITATPQSAALAGDSAPQTILPVAPSSLQFTSAAQSAVTAGQCSADVVLTTFDAANNPAPVTTLTPVSLGATGLTGVSFFAGSGCSGQAVTGVDIPAGNSSVTYSFRTDASGTGNLTASATGLGSPTQPATVVPGPPTRLAFLMGPVTAAASFCSGPQSLLRLQAQDALGNPSPVPANLDVTVAGTNPATTYSITFYSNNNCAPGGSTSLIRISGASHTSNTFTFKTNGAGTWAFTGTATGYTGATQDQTVTPLAPAQLKFTSAAQTVTRNQCSAILTFQLQDSLGNPSPPASPTNVTLTPSGGSFYTRSNCTGSISGNVLTLDGTASGSFYFQAPSNTGPYIIGISTSGGIASDSQTETIAP